MSLPPDLTKTDIGHGVWIHRVKGGVIIGHTHDDGYECSGSILFENEASDALKHTGRTLWKLVSDEPMTVMPSISNPECGLHGFITDGTWVPV